MTRLALRIVQNVMLAALYWAAGLIVALLGLWGAAWMLSRPYGME